jgi:hypothetical protein
VDGTGSRSCPVEGLGTSVFEPLNSATRELKRQLQVNNFTETRQHALRLCVTDGVAVSIARSTGGRTRKQGRLTP